MSEISPLSDPLGVGQVRNGVADVAYGTDASLLVRFYDHPKLDKAATEIAGHNVYRDVCYVSIRAPGSKDTVQRPARDADKRRFPRQWQQYELGKADEVVGFRIEEWAPISRSEAETLKHAGVQTVEQLAACSDSGLQNIGPGYMKLREKAKAFVQAAKDSSAVHAQAEEIAALKQELEFLKAQVAGQKPTRKPRKQSEQTESDESTD